MEAQLKQLRLKTQLSQERTSSPAPSDEDDHIKLSKQNYMQDKVGRGIVTCVCYPVSYSQ